MFSFPYELKGEFPELYNMHTAPDFAKAQSVQELTNSLRSLNALCVTLQYAHHYEGRVDQEIKEQTDGLINEKSGGELLNKVQLFKALQCLNYQIETSHLTELRELTIDEANAMKFLDVFTDALARFIVSSSSDYDKAKWELA